MKFMQSSFSRSTLWFERALYPRTLLLSVLLLGWAVPSHAEDSDRFRTYIDWRVGEFAPAWGVLDLRGLSYGANFNQNWGAELALDFWQLNLEGPTDGDILGEMAMWNLAPQMRFRVPLWNDKVVPYAIVGAGALWAQFNDRTFEGNQHLIDAEGAWTFTAVGGIGVDLFLADNIAFNLEGKYVWANPMTISIDNRDEQYDPSSFLATFGLRLFLDENNPQPLITKHDEHRPVRFYFGTQGGFSILTDGNWTPRVKLVPKVSAPFDTLNLNYTLSFGADFGENLGVELMLDHTEYSVQVDTLGTVSEYAVYTAMPLLRLRFPTATGKFVPYVMAGVGATYGENNDPKPKGIGQHIKAKGFSPGMLVGGGVEYFIARNLSFNFETRWRYSWGQEISIQDGPTLTGDTSEVQMTIGFRAYLWDVGKKEPY